MRGQNYFWAKKSTPGAIYLDSKRQFEQSYWADNKRPLHEIPDSIVQSWEGNCWTALGPLPSFPCNPPTQLDERNKWFFFLLSMSSSLSNQLMVLSLSVTIMHELGRGKDWKSHGTCNEIRQGKMWAKVKWDLGNSHWYQFLISIKGLPFLPKNLFRTG